MSRIKKGIVVCLLTATLLVSMVGMASAQDNIYWYLRSYDPGVTGADCEIYKESGYGPAGSVTITSGETKIWVANEPASVDVPFGTYKWGAALDYTDQQHGYYLDAGETITIKIGSLDPDTGDFTEAMSATEDGSGSAEEGESSTYKEITPGLSWTVPTGHYLALKLTMSGGSVKVDVHDTGGGNSASYIKCMGGCSEYPVPELSTIILTSAGLLALLGYVGYRRRNDK